MASLGAMVGKSAARILALAGWLVVPVAGRDWWPQLRFTGACTAKNFLNNMIFEHQGFTAGGAPWYKGVTAGGVDQYLYWDPDCGGGGDGQPRWIFTEKVPDPLKMRDLDGDNLCNYHARVNGPKNSYPPNTDFWYMDCGTAGIRKLLIVLGDITTTHTTTSLTTTTATTTTETTTRTTTSTTRTTTTRTTTSSTRTTTTRSTTTRTATSTTTTSTTTSLMAMHLTGACPFKYFLNDLTFVEQGRSASGSRLYKAAEADQWLYYDEDCNGGGNGAKRWIIGPHMPLPEFKEDLDQDGKCNYHARLDALGGMLEAPPRVSTWEMYCGLGWTAAVVHMELNSNYTFYDGLDYSTDLRLRGLFAEVCPQKAFLDNMTFRYAGNTASGAPYYRSLGSNQYIYFDPHCSGNPAGSSRWIIDDNPPNVTAQQDLDGDGTCDYHARAKSKDTRMPPKGSMWRVECGPSEWKDMWLALVRLPLTTTTTTQHRIHSAAAGVSSHLLAVLLLGGFVHFHVRP